MTVALRSDAPTIMYATAAHTVRIATVKVIGKGDCGRVASLNVVGQRINRRSIVSNG